MLVVESDLSSGKEMCDHFSRKGHEPLSIPNAESIGSAIQFFAPDMVILENEPHRPHDGSVLRTLRKDDQTKDLPVIMISRTASREDSIRALENGADDFVWKPIMFNELYARMNAVARRFGSNSLDQGIYKNGCLSVDFRSHRVFCEEKEIFLTLTEFNILRELIKKSGNVLTRDQLRSRALGSENVTDRTIDVHMASLRKKLLGTAKSIETVRGVGYRFVI